MSIRVRIALLSAALTAMILLALSAGVYLWFERSLTQEIDVHLRQLADTVTSQQLRDARPVFTGGQWQIQIPSFDPFKSPGLYAQILGQDGVGIDQTPDLPSYLDVDPVLLNRTLNGQSVYYTTDFQGAPVRVLSVPLYLADQPSNPAPATVQVAESLGPLQHTIEKLRLLLFGALGAGLALTALGAFVISGRSLRPLERITTTAREIGSSGDLSRRLDPPTTHDEVAVLSQTFNDMLDRLEAAFAAERRFVSDASHELRTPLTALRGNAEILRRRVEAGDFDREEAIEILTDIHDEAERMGRLVHNLLTLARADVGWRPPQEVLALDQVVEDVSRVAAPLAAHHRFTTQVNAEVDVLGNADQLKQLLLILLDNAFAYTPEGESVALALRAEGNTAELVVTDSGPGIALKERAHIFDRFYRGDAARAGRNVGAGLGLAIARWIVDCHAGEIMLRDVPVGTSIVVRLPIVASETLTEATIPPEPALARR